MSEENTTEVTPEVQETPKAPQPGTPEYDATMAATGVVATGKVPDKFKNEDGSVNMDALIQSYSELERKFHEPQAEPAVEKPVDAGPDAVIDELRVPDVDKDATEEQVQTEAAKVGITREDLGSMTTEIMRSGGISDEQRSSLNQRGIDDAVIDAVVEGQRARMRQQYAAAAEIVGSSDRLSKIFGWAAHNLDETQRAQINAGLASNASEITLRGLAAMYDTAVANKPKSQEMATSARKPGQVSSGREIVQGFSTKAEYYKAYDDLTKNPHDTKLRNMIEERMVKTDWTTIK